MKRDMELVRSILLAIEESEQAVMSRDAFYRGPRFKGTFSDNPPWNQKQIVEHVRIMEQAGLIKVEGVISPRGFSSLGLEWEGHEFLDNARDENVWQKAKSMFGEASFDALKQGLLEAAKQALLGQ